MNVHPRGLYLLTPDETNTAKLLERTEQALGAGVRWLQYRNKRADAALRREQAVAPPLPEGWEGQWLAGETGLLARIEPGRRAATLHYASAPDTLVETGDGSLAAAGIRVGKTPAGLRMRRSAENVDLLLEAVVPVESADGQEIAGRYHAAELDAEMIIEARDGGVYARFDGMLGTGRMERLSPAGRDLWLLATRRSMDAPAPGDWTLCVRRDAEGGWVRGLTLGCWLARGIEYTLVERDRARSP